jgi:hypothetical protein
MPNFTYLPGPDDPETVSTLGYSFTAGTGRLFPKNMLPPSPSCRGTASLRNRRATAALPART